MSTTITGLTLAPVLVIVGCAQAIARHDLFERRDSRIGRIGDRAPQDSVWRDPKAKQTQEPGERGHSNGPLEWRARQDSFPFPTSQRRVGT